jgi:hypothetical protein
METIHQILISFSGAVLIGRISKNSCQVGHCGGDNFILNPDG